MAEVRIGTLVPGALRFGSDLVARLYYGHHVVYPPGLLFVAETGNFVLTGNAATLMATRRVPLDAGTFTLSGQQITFARTMRLDPGSFVLTGVAANLHKGYRLFADVGAFALAGQDVTLRHLRLNAEAGVFTVAGQDSGLRAARRIPADAGAFSLTGVAAGLLKGFPAETGTFTLTGFSTEFIFDAILVSGDQQSGTDHIIYSGDQTGREQVSYEP